MSIFVPVVGTKQSFALMESLPAWICCLIAFCYSEAEDYINEYAQGELDYLDSLKE